MYKNLKGLYVVLIFVVYVVPILNTEFSTPPDRAILTVD
jgi:hypothetical protein